ncbi:MAG: type II toxin-antitoxin system VapC family toxin [Chloroflexi bacterium]|nr:type II toxin-antitoxin system VapC family toxin [Chloroflexota bacterium]
MVVVDASVAVKWLFEKKEYSAMADAFAIDLARRNEAIIAPYLLPIEVANTIRQHQCRGALTLDEARGRLARFQSYRVQMLAPEGLTECALTIAVEQNLPAVHDTYYLALTGIKGCEFWTAAQRLIRSLTTTLPIVRFIGEYGTGETVR